MEAKRYYWLKMKRDFFRRHDIRILLDMENGRDIVLFYIELMIESVDHEGALRFSKEKPYTNGMLASLTNTPPDIVELALNTLIDFGLVEIDEDKTIILPKVIEMIDSCIESDEARRSKRYRERKKAERDANVTPVTNERDANVTPVTDGVTNRHESIEYRDKSIENRVERNTKERKFAPPTLEEVKAYCQERNSPVDAQQFFEYYEVSSWKDSKGNPVKNWKQKLITWEKHDAPVVHCATPQKSNPYEIDWSKI